MKRRLARQGIYSIADFCALGPRRAGAVWGSRLGDRMWFELHGIEMPPVETQTRTLGHSHVLAPDNRGADKAFLVLRRLTLKAAARLRRTGYLTSLIDISVRSDDDGTRWQGAYPCPPTQDSFALLPVVAHLWARMMAEIPRPFGPPRFKKVSVTFLNLQPETGVQLSLLDPPPPPARRMRGQGRTADGGARPLALSRAIDRLNARYGQPVVTMASNLTLSQTKDLGTKIAFTRIPEMPEFHE